MFKTFFNSAVSKIKMIPSVIKTAPGKMHNAYSWTKAFIIVTLPVMIKSFCKSIMAFINAPVAASAVK